MNKPDNIVCDTIIIRANGIWETILPPIYKGIEKLNDNLKKRRVKAYEE